MKGKKTFNAYCDWIDVFEKLSDEEAGQLIKHIFRYVNDQEPEPENRLIELVFEPIKKVLKKDLKQWLDTCDRNRANGKKGGRPKNPKNPSGFFKNPTKPKKADKDKDKDKDINKKEMTFKEMFGYDLNEL